MKFSEKILNNKTNVSLIDMLCADGVPHTVKISPSSVTVTAFGRQNYIPFEQSTDQKQIQAEHLNFIKDVKTCVIEAAEQLQLKEPKPKYINFLAPPALGEVVRDAVEIDISGAYWNCAYKMGLISDALFEQGLQVPKFVRLVAFGAAA